VRTFGLGIGIVTFMLTLLFGTASAAYAEQDGAVPEPEVRCVIDDPRLEELSGLAADSTHLYAVNDGGTRLEVAVLGDDCRVRDLITAPTDPYDVEDLALGPDGTFWLGDTGDNRGQRETVALHALSRAGTSVLYRLTYPDGPRDAEALVVDREGTPYIITKDVLGSSRVYRPAQPLTSPGPTPLEKVATISLLPTRTPGGPVGMAGSVLITGAALSSDGSVVAVRTYTDAYLYPVTEGDIVAAFSREPVRVPLPHERQGEAIAFTPDGTLLSASERRGEPLRAVPDAVGLVGDASAGVEERGTGTTPETAEDGPTESTEHGSGLGVVPSFLIAIALAAVLLAGFGRRRR